MDHTAIEIHINIVVSESNVNDNKENFLNLVKCNVAAYVQYNNKKSVLEILAACLLDID